MAYKSEIEKPYMTFITSLPSYWEKVRGLLAIIFGGVLAGLLATVLVAVLTGCFDEVNNGFDVLRGLAGAANMLFDFMPPANDGTQSSDVISVGICRVAGFLATCVLSGFLVAKFLSPRRVVQFAPYILVDTDKQILRIRFRILLPLHKYLHDVQLRMVISDESQRQSGKLKRERYFEYCAPSGLSRLYRGGYESMRGIWYIEVGLDRTSNGKTLRSVLHKLDIARQAGKEPEGLRIEAWVSGTTPSGEVVFERRQYPLDKLLIGYNYVSIWRKEVETESGTTGRKDLREYFPEHFKYVYKQELKPDDASYFNCLVSNAPDQGRLLERGKVLPRYYGIKEVVERFRARKATGIMSNR